MDITKLLTTGGIGASVAAGAVVGALLFAPTTSGAQEGDTGATTEATEEGEKKTCHGKRHHVKGRIAARAAEVIGIEVGALKQALQDGSTMVEVAADNGVSESELVDGLLEGPYEKIDEAVADGRIDEAEAEERKANIRERVTARVNGEKPERPEGFEERGPRFGGPPPFVEQGLDA